MSENLNLVKPKVEPGKVFHRVVLCFTDCEKKSIRSEICLLFLVT